jgi:hypothetical protein
VVIRATGSGVLSFVLTASDFDLPRQNLTYSIDPFVPQGLTIDPQSGAVNWTPTEAQGPGSYTVTFRVTDDGEPRLSTSPTIRIDVSEVNKEKRLTKAIPRKTAPRFLIARAPARPNRAANSPVSGRWLIRT